MRKAWHFEPKQKTCTVSFWAVAPKRFELATCVEKRKCRELLDLFVAPSLSSLAWNFDELASYAFCVTFWPHQKICTISFWTVAPKHFKLATCVGKRKCRWLLDLYIAPCLSSIALKFTEILSYTTWVTFTSLKLRSVFSTKASFLRKPAVFLKYLKT